MRGIRDWVASICFTFLVTVSGALLFKGWGGRRTTEGIQFWIVLVCFLYLAVCFCVQTTRFLKKHWLEPKDREADENPESSMPTKDAGRGPSRVPDKEDRNGQKNSGMSSPRRSDRFLPGVPGKDIEQILSVAPGDEIGTGKFDHPESSAALAVNTFGYFLHRVDELPLLPGCPGETWPARSLSIEKTVRFPWRGGRHPVLDCLVVTRSGLIGIESKRFEPFRGPRAAVFSDAYWRAVWGDHMTGYERVRDSLRDDPRCYAYLDAAQLVKHAFGLRSETHRPGPHQRLKPILLYVYAEPEFWPGTKRRIGEEERARHREEIDRFTDLVERDEVAFRSCCYRTLLEGWQGAPGEETRRHARAIMAHFSP